MLEVSSIPTSLPPWVHIGSDESADEQQPAQRPDHINHSSTSNNTSANTSIRIPDHHHHHHPNESSPKLPSRPRSQPATYHQAPPAHFKPGRKWDALRTAEPALLSAPVVLEQIRWKPFMQSGPNNHEEERRFDYDSDQHSNSGDGYGGDDSGGGGAYVVDAEWMRHHMPVALRGWDPRDEEDPTLPPAGRRAGLKGFQGVMYRGKWLISPERQERTVRLFWVSCNIYRFV
jgi:hypothetical protein